MTCPVRAVEPNLRAAVFGYAKLVQPRIREGTVHRPDLAYRLRPTARSTVALIVAPAGYGKTTILAELAGLAGSRPFVWITADSTDNDPLSFARCITNGLEQSDAIPAGTLRAKAKSGDSHAVLVARLVRALKAAHPLAIAIDDLQFVTSTRSLKIVEAIANNIPPRSQLLLASRTRPRLGLTALRAAGRLIEIGTDDLRLSAEQARGLLRASGVDVLPADGADLITRAEGWPAGLYLAGLAYAGDGQALGSFGGSDRFVGDYFDAECLDELDAEDLDFLIEASVLERLSAPVCDAVLRTSGSAARLERIARSNLFVAGLGSGKPRVYRMHPMLREALSEKLQRHDPSRTAAIADRAADWSESHGNVEETVEYAWTAGNRERFAALAEQAALPLLQVGHLATIERWLARLDTDLLDRYPALAICGAYVHDLRGRPEEADAWAATAEHAPVETVMPDGTPSPEPWTAVLRAAMCRNGKDEMRQDAARALSGLAEGSPWRPTALTLLGVGQLLAGETVAADELLAEAHLAATSGRVHEHGGRCLRNAVTPVRGRGTVGRSRRLRSLRPAGAAGRARRERPHEPDHLRRSRALRRPLQRLGGCAERPRTCARLPARPSARLVPGAGASRVGQGASRPIRTERGRGRLGPRGDGPRRCARSGRAAHAGC